MKQLHPGVRAAIVIIGILVILNLIVGGVDRASGGRRDGAEGSTYTTAPQGLAAFESLLARHGRDTSRVRSDLARTELPRDAVVFVMDGYLPPEEVAAVAAFVTDGGRLVIAGAEATQWLPQVVPGDASWSFAPAGTAHVLVPTPDVDGVTAVRSTGAGVWTDSAGGLPVLGNDLGALLFVQRVGRGSVAALASVSPLTNDLLDEADNAALGLALSGGRQRVLFVESVHGHVDGRGLGAVPADARWAFGLLAVAGCVWLVVRGRRLGPPERPDRELAPPRRLYTEALGAVLRRTKNRSDAVISVQYAAQRRLAQRAGLRHADGFEAMRRVGPRFGLDPREVEAILTPAHSDEDVLAAGRALAKLEHTT